MNVEVEDQVHYDVLFTPCVTVSVIDGKITDVSVDWSDSLRNVYDGLDVHEEPDDPKNPREDVRLAAEAACAFLDEKPRCDRAQAALQPGFEADETLALWFTPQAIRDHFDGDEGPVADWVAEATDEQLAEVGSACLGDDSLYSTFHEVMRDVIVEEIG